MRVIIILLLVAATATAQSTPPKFVQGNYTIGQRVSWAGSVYQSLKSGKRTANPYVNAYWKDVTKEYTLAPMSVEQLAKRVDSLTRRIEALETKKAARYTSPILELTIDTVLHTIEGRPAPIMLNVRPWITPQTQLLKH